MALMVGVSGVRGLIGQTLTPEVALEFGLAYGTLVGAGKRVIVARDTRPSGEMYAHLIGAALTAVGCQVVRLGVAMTPTVGYTMRQGGFDAGVIITASHNPAIWNGIKFLDERGLAPDPARAAEIASIREARSWKLVRERFAPITVDDEAGERHAEAVFDSLDTDMAPIAGTRIVLDSINGAGCLVTPAFLTQLGCEVIHLNSEPNGDFAHTPEPTAQNLAQLCQAVRDSGAQIGFAQDPDADRLAIVDEHGRYVGEEYTLALAALAMLATRKGPVAANLSTSRMIDQIAAIHGVEVIRTAVGEANVASAMLQRRCVIGGEGNGGVIDPRISWVRDSLSAMSLVLQLMARSGQRISELVGSLPRYALLKTKLECDSRERVAEITRRVAERFADEQINTSDGTRVDFAEGWVHVRGSNTEPIVRLMAEAEDERQADVLLARVREAAGV